jgi:hypothetical protein
MVSTKQLQGQEFLILQVVSRYICYVGDRNLSCVTMSIRLSGFYCVVSDFNMQIGKPIKNLVLIF